jgi:hypothetical protein
VNTLGVRGESINDRIRLRGRYRELISELLPQFGNDGIREEPARRDAPAQPEDDDTVSFSEVT